MRQALMAVFAALVFVTNAGAQPVLQRSVISNGALSMIGLNTGLHGTTAQPTVGYVLAPSFGVHHGFWNANTIPTGIGDEPIAPERFEFSLGQNWPNPFSFTTAITYSVATGAPVRTTLVVYDIRGARVRSLVNIVHPPGRYTVRWDGQNDQGRVIANGIYFTRLQAGGFTSTRKLIHIQ